jgi:pyrophosphatase PpaX
MGIVFLGAIIVITAFLALYWVFYGQRKHNEMMNPKRKTELKAILFDLDGVIVDSFESWYGVFNQVLKERGGKNITKEEFRKGAWGGPLQREIKYFPGMTTTQLRDRYNELIVKHVEKSKLIPGIKEVLQKAKKNKIKTGVVTNAFRKYASVYLKHHKILKYFDAMVTWEDVENPKPDPEPILKACEKLDVISDEILYVGDTKNDYMAGKAAGCVVVGLNTKGDFVISKMRDLLGMI